MLSAKHMLCARINMYMVDVNIPVANRRKLNNPAHALQMLRDTFSWSKPNALIFKRA